MKACRDGAEVTCSGRLFQMREAATGNALSPTMDSRVDSTTCAYVDDDLSHCLELMSKFVTEILQVPGYVMRTDRVYSTHCGTCKQCRS